ncbi:hypothetical protein HGRIS_005728 [Hohenbuehelia grisea]|uniref:Uncharacterized protein n=1 Tax=Hohenbuehelia grisea TaxID=104357 RepID=A0ABR3JZZ8_9AGAR
MLSLARPTPHSLVQHGIRQLSAQCCLQARPRVVARPDLKTTGTPLARSLHTWFQRHDCRWAHGAAVGSSQEPRSLWQCAHHREFSTFPPLHSKTPPKRKPMKYTLNFMPYGWSIDFDAYPLRDALFGPSEHFLRIPQIDMIVKIHYRIPGEIHPIAWRTHWVRSPLFPENSLLFAVGEKFYLLGFSQPQGKPISGVKTEDEVSASAAESDASSPPPTTVDVYQPPPSNLAHYDVPKAINELRYPTAGALGRGLKNHKRGISHLPHYRAQKSSQGRQMLNRILDRDPTVAEDLFKEGYLSYLPKDEVEVEPSS